MLPADVLSLDQALERAYSPERPLTECQRVWLIAPNADPSSDTRVRRLLTQLVQETRKAEQRLSWVVLDCGYAESLLNIFAPPAAPRRGRELNRRQGPLVIAAAEGGLDDPQDPFRFSRLFAAHVAVQWREHDGAAPASVVRAALAAYGQLDALGRPAASADHRAELERLGAEDRQPSLWLRGGPGDADAVLRRLGQGRPPSPPFDVAGGGGGSLATYGSQPGLSMEMYSNQTESDPPTAGRGTEASADPVGHQRDQPRDRTLDQLFTAALCDRSPVKRYRELLRQLASTAVALYAELAHDGAAELEQFEQYATAVRRLAVAIDRDSVARLAAAAPADLATQASIVALARQYEDFVAEQQHREAQARCGTWYRPQAPPAEGDAPLGRVLVACSWKYEVRVHAGAAQLHSGSSAAFLTCLPAGERLTVEFRDPRTGALVKAEEVELAADGPARRVVEHPPHAAGDTTPARAPYDPRPTISTPGPSIDSLHDRH